MKKFILLSFLFSVFSIQALLSQTYVSTNPQDKNVILEEFTGVHCPNCPQGHQVATQILTNNPGRVWAVAFHPFNSNYTTPYPGNPDFRRHHPDSLYMTPYCGSSRFMPSAFINRRIYGGERIQTRTVWTNYTNQFLTEASEVNVGLATTYDEITKQLDILVEIYYTANMTDQNTLNVLFTESGLIAQQSGGSINYVHNHIFRETFTAQWGDPITESTTQGSFIQKSFIYDNSGDEYNMDECEIVAYIVNAETTEVISGIGVHAGDNTNFSAPVADFIAENQYIPVGESTIFTDLSTGGPETWEWFFEGGSPSTSNLQSPPPVFYNEPGIYEVSLTVTNTNGSSTETKTDYIYTGYAPTADFSYEATLNANETIIDFTDLSTNNPTSWEWTFEGGTPGTSSIQHPTEIIYISAGYYDISLVASNEFGSDSLIQTIYVDVLSSIAENKVRIFKVYPNPTSGILNIEIKNNAVDNIRIYNSLGRMIYHINNIQQENIIIDLSKFNNGIYYLKIETLFNSFSKRIILSD